MWSISVTVSFLSCHYPAAANSEDSTQFSSDYWSTLPATRLGLKHQSGAYDEIFITVTLLRVCGCVPFSLTRGRVCTLVLLMALARAVIFESDSRGTRDHILLPQIRDFAIRRLLRLAGLRWRYSTPPPHGSPITPALTNTSYNHFARTSRKTQSPILQNEPYWSVT
jgi:hypothetical protein